MVLTPNMPYLTLRVKFQKVGSLQYISHLDLVRTMHKIIVRAKLPLWYTEGFNPKPKMIFAAPLSCGVESLCEFMDVRLIEQIPPQEAIKRLNANVTDEMRVLDAYYTDTKPSLLKWLAYTITIKTDGAGEELACMCREALAKESLVVAKKGKPGEELKLQNIAPLIKNATVETYGDLLHIECLLSASPADFLNPDYVIKALKSECGILSNADLTKEYYTILRTAAYKEDMTSFGAH